MNSSHADRAAPVPCSPIMVHNGTATGSNMPVPKGVPIPLRPFEREPDSEPAAKLARVEAALPAARRGCWWRDWRDLREDTPCATCGLVAKAKGYDNCCRPCADGQGEHSSRCPVMLRDSCSRCSTCFGRCAPGYPSCCLPCAVGARHSRRCPFRCFKNQAYYPPEIGVPPPEPTDPWGVFESAGPDPNHLDF